MNKKCEYGIRYGCVEIERCNEKSLENVSTPINVSGLFYMVKNIEDDSVVWSKGNTLYACIKKSK